MADIYVATTGNDTTGTGSSGNPYATPGKAASVAAANDTVYIKSGTYTNSVNTANVSGGYVDTPGAIINFQGYQTTPGDMGTKPIIRAGLTLDWFIRTLGAVTNIAFDGNGFPTSGGIIQTRFVYFCSVVGVNAPFNACNLVVMSIGVGVARGGNGLDNCAFAIGVFISACNQGTANGGIQDACIIQDCDFAFVDAQAKNCIARTSTYGFLRTSATNCIADGNANGFTPKNTDKITPLVNCAGYNNSGYNYDPSTTVPVLNFVALSADPFTNSAGGDFSLNTTSGGGAACRATGIPGAFTGIATTGYLDRGAAQHADSGASGGGAPIIGSAIVRAA